MTTNKVGRNDPCPCGSGKKYKQCCMLNQNAGTAATYTPAGKRKFKAKVITMDPQAVHLFQQTNMHPSEYSDSASGEPTHLKFSGKLKFKTTDQDYRIAAQNEENITEPTTDVYLEAIQSNAIPAVREGQVPSPEETFKPTKQDFRKKEE